MSIVLQAAAVVVLWLALASSAQAQEPEDASLVGARVRVRYCNASGRKSADGKGPCYRTEGQLLASTPDALRVQPSNGTVRDVPRAEVTRLELSLGTRRSTGRGALIGGGIGWLPREKWKDVAEDQVTVAVVGRDGRVGLGLRVAF